MVDRIEYASPVFTNSCPTDHPFYAQMEQVQEKVNPFLETLPSTNTDPILHNATNDTYNEILDLANDIRTAKGMPKLEKEWTIRSFHDLLVRIAELAEKHIYMRKERDHAKKAEIEGKNQEIANWTRNQGYTNFGSGIGYPAVLLVATLLVGEPVSSAVRAIKDVVPAGARGLENWFESFKTTPQFEQSLYIQTAASEKQAVEGLKNLPRELQQKLQQYLQQELRAIQASSQRG